MELKGLSYKCRQMTEKMGLPDIMFKAVSKGEIKQAIKQYSSLELKEEVQNSNKVGNRWSEDILDNTYMKCMSLPNSRVWMRYRARSIKGVKVINKNCSMIYHTGAAKRKAESPKNTLKPARVACQLYSDFDHITLINL